MSIPKLSRKRKEECKKSFLVGNQKRKEVQVQMTTGQDENFVNVPVNRKITVKRMGNSRLEFFPKIVDQASVQYVVRTSPNRQTTKHYSKIKELFGRVLREKSSEITKVMEGKIFKGMKRER